MKCPKCGSEINEGSFFCSSCGMQIDKPQDNASNQSNGKKTPVGLIVIVIILALIIISVFVGISMSKEEDKKENKTNQEQTVEKEDKKEDKEDTKTVTYSNYTFEVPEHYIATPSDSQLLILNADNSLAEAVIYQTGTTYSTLSSMKDQIVDLLKAQESSQSQGYDFTNAVTKEKTYGGKQFLITSGIKQGTIDLDITYAEADDGVFIISIAKTDGNIEDSERDELYSIISTANNE